MGETREEQIRRIAEEALGLDDAAREEFLAESCGDDEALRTEVRRMLDADSEQMTVVDHDSHVSAALPRQIGRYRIRRVLGTGGMGTVFEAIQDKPRRKVAVKVMRAGITSPKAARRFEYESQILGRLSHTGIAQVYEAGTYDDGTGGVPYFAMEYIAGARTVLEYVHDVHPSRDDMITMFCKICDAVHHGHTKGIIHRDLKPGNVLVDRAGDPRIIDFGVARATDSDMAVTTLQTEVGQLVGTVQYMSPEQCEADPDILDTRSDVYALGVMLYELLTNRLPYDLKTVPLYEAANIIREGTPSKLSTIDRGLRGDLETIVSKAIEKDRDRRYQSALELKQDLERYIRGDPIEARPPSIGYQLQLMARRNRGVLVTLGIIMLVMAGATIWSLMERNKAVEAEMATQAALVEAESARDQAETEAARAARVSDFLQHVISMVSPRVAQGETLTMDQVLERAAASVDEQFGEFPEVEAEVRQALGRIYLDMGLLPQAEQNIREAITLRETIGESTDPELLSSKIRLAEIMMIADRIDDADVMTAKLVDATREALGPDSLVTLDAMEIRCNMLEKIGEYHQIPDLARAVQEGYEQLVGPDDERTYRARLLVLGSDLMTFVISGNRQPGSEEQALLQARVDALLQEVAKKLGSRHPVTLQIILIDGTLAFLGQDVAGAQARLSEVLEDCRAVLGSTHPKTLEAMRLLGMISIYTGDVVNAKALLTEALDGYERTTGLDAASALSTSVALANVYMSEEDLERTIELCEGPYESLIKQYGPYHPETFLARAVYGSALVLSGRLSEGRPLVETTVEFLDAMAPGSGGVQRSLNQRFVLIVGLLKSEDPADWQEGMGMVLTCYEEAVASDEVGDAVAEQMLSRGIRMAVAQDRRDGLVELVDPYWQFVSGDNDEGYADDRTIPGGRSVITTAPGDLSERLDVLARSLEYLAQEPGHDQQIEPMIDAAAGFEGLEEEHTVRLALAKVFVDGRQGRLDEARARARETLPGAQESLGEDHESVVGLQEWLAAHP
ncbi:MAG: serine/threonine-protein kinase [Phycisphaerales bacterium]|nr:serine/threonine-protein kinase [Phycisphaerales bacterium]